MQCQERSVSVCVVVCVVVYECDCVVVWLCMSMCGYV